VYSAPHDGLALGCDGFLIGIATIALVYHGSVFALKRHLRKLDRTTNPFALQLRDLEIVRRARSRAASREETQSIDRLRIAILFTFSVIPLGLVVALLLVLLGCSIRGW
jgi:hypothetical protein